MVKLNKVDHEIIEILKRIFLTRNVHPLYSDDNLRVWMIRAFFLVSVAGLLVRITAMLSGKVISTEMSAGINMPIAIFFGILFLHINNESENASLIVFILTWLSIVIGLYV